MKNFRIFLIALIASSFIFTACNDEELSKGEMEDVIEESTVKRVCSSADYLEKQLLENPEMRQNLERMERQIADFNLSDQARNSSNVYTIPVVVHVVYKTNAQNISTAQIQSQLDVLNKDFRRLNSDANNNWGQAADSQIEFCLASVAPNGNSTSGITRTQTTKSAFNPDLDQMKKSNQGGKNPWNTSKYLNIWVCNLSGGTLGYAQFPGGPSATDGVVIGYNYFGTMGTAQSPFNLGRTGTHEVGHYLNLYHIWGDGACGQDDNVSDTPSSDDANYGCPNGHTSCSSTDMIENYMDYTDDACMNLFTTGQKNRMRAVLSTGGARSGLSTSNGCGGSTGGGGGTPSPTCTDGIQNGTETGVDCGGSCSPCVSATEQIKIIVRTDLYGSETTWWLKDDATGQKIASGGPYSDGIVKNRVKKVTVNSNGCYTFRINDSYGDGICCDNGNGKYWIRKVVGNTLIRSGNGKFGSKQIKKFCMSPNGNRISEETLEGEEKLIKSLSISNIDGVGNIDVDIKNPPAEGQLSILTENGQLVRSFPLGDKSEIRKINVDFLEKGTYELVMGKEGKSISQAFTKE